MQDFADMAEAHEWTLRRLREMAGRLTEQAYLRAGAAAGRDDEAQARWMLVFDRMARGLRLSIALEARLSRERRWDADELGREAAGGRHAPRWRRAAAAPEDAEPCEADREGDDDGLPGDATIAERIGRLKAIVEASGAPEPPDALSRAERLSLGAQRAERARLAGTARPPDEPWDVVGAFDAADAVTAADDPPWRGSG
jgi:hypothetical protein